MLRLGAGGVSEATPGDVGGGGGVPRRFAHVLRPFHGDAAALDTDCG